MLYLIYLTIAVFSIFWLGDFILTLQTVRALGPHVEVNPLLRAILTTRGHLIYIVKPLELVAFGYLIWYLSVTQGRLSFHVLLGFILMYALLVWNNARVYFKASGTESPYFYVAYLGLVGALLLFMYLNFLLYTDLSYALSRCSGAAQALPCPESNADTAQNDTDTSRGRMNLTLPVRRDAG